MAGDVMYVVITATCVTTAKIFAMTVATYAVTIATCGKINVNSITPWRQEIMPAHVRSGARSVVTIATFAGIVATCGMIIVTAGGIAETCGTIGAGANC